MSFSILYCFISLILISNINSSGNELRIDMREFVKDQKNVETMARDA